MHKSGESLRLPSYGWSAETRHPVWVAELRPFRFWAFARAFPLRRKGPGLRAMRASRQREKKKGYLSQGMAVVLVSGARLAFSVVRGGGGPPSREKLNLVLQALAVLSPADLNLQSPLWAPGGSRL